MKNEKLLTKQEFDEFLDSFSKETGEFTEDELYKIGVKYKELPTSCKRWDELVKILGVDKNGETFRQWIKSKQYADGSIETNVQLISGQTIEDISFPEFEEKTEEIKRDLYKQQIKTRDTFNAYRRVLREEARLEDFKDLMKECVSKLHGLTDIKYEYVADEMPENEAVLLLSDLHIGVQIDNYYNKYNLEIAKKRVNKLVSDTIAYCRRNNVTRLNVVNLGDLVAGAIHTNARLEQEINVVEQIMQASEILANALNELQLAAPELIYRSCTDNHSRAVADLHESIEAENYGKLIDFYLEARLKDTNIIFANDNIDQEIGLIELQNGKLAVFCHGHHDGIQQLFQNMSSFVGKVVDYAYVGHYHNEKVKTFNGFKVYVNGSIVGVDQYAFSKRLFGKPSQTLLIYEGCNTIHHSICLDICE